MPETFHLLAAELAFGLLDSNERIEAEQLRATDSNFADEVAKWEDIAEAWIGGLADHQSSPHLLDRVARVVGPATTSPTAINARTAVPLREPGFWRPLAMAASVLAAVFAGLWISRLGIPTPSGSPLEVNPVGRFRVAQIGGAGDPQLATVLYDSDAGTLTIRIAAIASGPAKAPEIWLINGTNPPQSLGFGQAGGAIRMQANARLQRAMVGGAILAITLEPVSDQPHAAPSSKILGTGTISPL